MEREMVGDEQSKKRRERKCIREGMEVDRRKKKENRLVYLYRMCNIYVQIYVRYN